MSLDSNTADIDTSSDRKAILSNGVVRCVGSSLFLKSKFGVGYNLNIAKTPACDTQILQSFMAHEAPSAVQLRHVGGEIVFQLPYTSTSMFGSLFETINHEQQRLGIASYGLSMTTLEEVFLSLQADLDELNEGLSSPSIQTCACSFEFEQVCRSLRQF